MEVVKEPEAQTSKIDILYQLERKIIEILLLYGNVEEEFEDVLIKTNEYGEPMEVSEKNNYKVFQRIYLSLQEDEVELANGLFRAIYNDLVAFYHHNEVFNIEQYLMHLPVELAQEVTDILMEDELYKLHNWEGQNIIPIYKSENTAQYVSETILTMRWYLVDKIIDELKSSLSAEPGSDNSEILIMAMDYHKLINSFSSKLGRVMSRYSN